MKDYFKCKVCNNNCSLVMTKDNEKPSFCTCSESIWPQWDKITKEEFDNETLQPK